MIQILKEEYHKKIDKIKIRLKKDNVDNNYHFARWIVPKRKENDTNAQEVLNSQKFRMNNYDSESIDNTQK